MKSAIQAELPNDLVPQARAFVEQGWAGDFNELLAEVLRRYLDSHSSRLAEWFIREDLIWGVAWPGVKTANTTERNDEYHNQENQSHAGWLGENPGSC